MPIGFGFLVQSIPKSPYSRVACSLAPKCAVLRATLDEGPSKDNAATASQLP